MREIVKNLDRKFAEVAGFEVAYRFAAIDTYAALGDGKNALLWLWRDMAREGVN